MKKRTLSILGCGWLGLPLAMKRLEQGDHVRGSTRDPNKLELLKKRGIDPYIIDTDQPLEDFRLDPFWESEVLVLNIPPGRRQGDVLSRHPNEITSILDRAAQGEIRKILFVSSTSVFDASPGTKHERDLYGGNATRDSGKALRIIEKRLRSDPRFQWTILRPGGLYGYDRHPANYLAGKQELSGGGRPVNLVHRDDLIEVISRVLDREIWGDDFNVVSDKHPTREQFYRAMAREHGLEEPQFKSEGLNEGGKVVSNEKLKRRLDYQFLYPDPAVSAH